MFSIHPLSQSALKLKVSLFYFCIILGLCLYSLCLYLSGFHFWSERVIIQNSFCPTTVTLHSLFLLLPFIFVNVENGCRNKNVSIHAKFCISHWFVKVPVFSPASLSLQWFSLYISARKLVGFQYRLDCLCSQGDLLLLLFSF